MPRRPDVAGRSCQSLWPSRSARTLPRGSSPATRGSCASSRRRATPSWQARSARTPSRAGSTCSGTWWKTRRRARSAAATWRRGMVTHGRAAVALVLFAAPASASPNLCGMSAHSGGSSRRLPTSGGAPLKISSSASTAARPSGPSDGTPSGGPRVAGSMSTRTAGGRASATSASRGSWRSQSRGLSLGASKWCPGRTGGTRTSSRGTRRSPTR
mmetsp:Transcript_86964/g.246542  ORF Transcript_86964/g.246542 Transcript_86964/m.246542 type:complete len:214 (+) Transcript_86964:287-928(+)